MQKKHEAVRPFIEKYVPFQNITIQLNFATNELHSKCDNIYKRLEFSWARFQVSQKSVGITM